VSPHSTVEELYLAGALVRGLGSDNIDYRLRNAEFPAPSEGIRWLGTSIASLSTCSACWWWAPICARTIRCLHSGFVRRRAMVVQVSASIQKFLTGPCLSSTLWCRRLANGSRRWPALPQRSPRKRACRLLTTRFSGRFCLGYRSLAAGRRAQGNMLLGNAAAHHAQASRLLALAQLDWRAHRCHGGLSDRSCQHRRCTVRWRSARQWWFECGSDARRWSQGRHSAEHGACPLTLRRCRRPVRRLPIPKWLSP
jgi:hypothetical protein